MVVIVIFHGHVYVHLDGKVHDVEVVIIVHTSLHEIAWGTRFRRSTIREFKLRVSGNGKLQIRTFLAKFSLNVFVSYFLSCVERIVMHCSFKTASSFTLYCLIP